MRTDSPVTRTSTNLPLPQVPAPSPLTPGGLAELPEGSVVRRWWGSGDYDTSYVLVRAAGRSFAAFGSSSNNGLSIEWVADGADDVHMELLWRAGLHDIALLSIEQTHELPPGSIVLHRRPLADHHQDTLWHRSRDGWQQPSVDGTSPTIEVEPGGVLGLVALGTPYDERVRKHKYDPASLDSVRTHYFQLVDRTQGRTAAVRALQNFDAAIAGTLSAAAKQGV